MKNRGKKATIYLPESSARHLDRLIKTTGASASSLIATAVSGEVVRKHQRLQISDAAYVAISIGRFDLLTRMEFNDQIIIAVKDGVIGTVDAPGALFEGCSALRTYLKKEVVYCVRTEIPESLSGVLNRPQYFGSEKEAKEFMHCQFERFTGSLDVESESMVVESEAVVYLIDGGVISINISEIEI